MDLINAALAAGARTSMTKKDFLEAELSRWIASPERMMQINAEKYYHNEHDILQRKREVIGPDGVLVEVTNLPNNKIIDNQYSKAVDQKTNYLFAKPFTLETKSKAYEAALKPYFGHRFRRKIKRLGRSAINQGLAWLHPYYDESGALKFKVFEGYEILPFWRDSEHTDLDSAIRLYSVEGYEGTKAVTIDKVEYYTRDGIERYTYKNKRLTLDVENPSTAYIETQIQGQDMALNWEQIPLIAFKSSDLEIPLLAKVKSLQDGINLIVSNFMNGMEESPQNTILVIENYDGTDLGEFRRNLATYSAVKVRSVDGARGDVRALTVEVNAENYKAIYEILKNALIENAKALDAKSDKTGQANEKNILSMYSELDIDANGTELEFQAAFEDLLTFIQAHLANTGAGDFTGETVEILFNRDIQVSESDTIANARASKGLISDETIVANHPWVTDKAVELRRLKKERDAFMSADPFRQTPEGDDAGGDIDG